ncbi:hypothetical protein ACLKA7_000810 [Drosophila subpalustris]
MSLALLLSVKENFFLAPAVGASPTVLAPAGGSSEVIGATMTRAIQAYSRAIKELYCVPMTKVFANTSSWGTIGVVLPVGTLVEGSVKDFRRPVFYVNVS